MEKTVLRYIWRHSKRQQLFVLALTLSSFPILYLSLEVPKIIVNDALGRSDFPKLVAGVTLSQIEILVLLCVAFLLLAISNGVFKMYINIYKGTIAERMLRRLRYQLIDRLLRFPRKDFENTPRAELIPMVTSELEPLGGVMGDAIATPVFQAGQMLTILSFLVVQDPLLGLAAVVLVPVQAWLIPRIQKRINLLNRERVRRIRMLSEDISETTSGFFDIRVNDAADRARAEYSRQFGELFRIRLEIFRKKFSMKFLNNLLNQVTPFMFYLIGGILVIRGSLTLGALVAAIAAHKDFTSPWRELLNFYNQYMDASVRYETVVERFVPDRLIDAEPPESRLVEAPRLLDDVRVVGAVTHDAQGFESLASVSLSIPAGAMTAIVGADSIARDHLAQLIAGIREPEAGRVEYGGSPSDPVPRSVLGRRLAYVGPDTWIFRGTVKDNVDICLNRFARLPDRPTAEQQSYIREAQAADNSPFPPDGPWIDYAAAGFESEGDYALWGQKVIRAIDAETDLSQAALNLVIDKNRYPDLAGSLVALREPFFVRLIESRRPISYRRYDERTFEPSVGILENIIFGVPVDDRFTPAAASRRPDFRRLIVDAGAETSLIELGRDFAQALVEMHHESPPGSTGDEIYRIIEPEEIPELAAMMSTPVDRGASSKYAARFIELALRLVPEKHHFQLQDSTIGAVMAARSAFAADAGKELRSLVERVKIDTFMSGQTIIDNLLFGHVDDDDPATQEHARVTAIELLDQHGLKESIIGLIGDIPAGSGGGLIPAPGRERLALIRALAKKPDLLVLNQPLRSFPDSARARVRSNIRRLLPEATIVWLEREATAVDDFEKIYKLSDGRAVAMKANEALPAPVVDRSSCSSDASLDELFAGVHPGKLRQLSFDIDRRCYRSGDVVFEQGKPSAGIYVLAQGEIEIQRDASTTLARAGRGETLGLFATLSGTPHAVSGVATSDATVVFIDRDALLNWSRSDAEVATALLHYSAHRALRIMRSNQDLAS